MAKKHAPIKRPTSKNYMTYHLAVRVFYDGPNDAAIADRVTALVRRHFMRTKDSARDAIYLVDKKILEQAVHTNGRRNILLVFRSGPRKAASIPQIPSSRISVAMARFLRATDLDMTLQLKAYVGLKQDDTVDPLDYVMDVTRDSAKRSVLDPLDVYPEPGEELHAPTFYYDVELSLNHKCGMKRAERLGGKIIDCFGIQSMKEHTASIINNFAIAEIGDNTTLRFNAVNKDYKPIPVHEVPMSDIVAACQAFLDKERAWSDANNVIYQLKITAKPADSNSSEYQLIANKFDIWTVPKPEQN